MTTIIPGLLTDVPVDGGNPRAVEDPAEGRPAGNYLSGRVLHVLGGLDLAAEVPRGGRHAGMPRGPAPHGRRAGKGTGVASPAPARPHRAQPKGRGVAVGHALEGSKTSW